MLNKQKLKERGLDEARRFLFRFIYVWAFCALFALHKTFVLRGSIGDGQGLAIINAFILAKIIFIAETFHVAEHFARRPPIYAVLYKSAVFTIILISFRVAEDVLHGMWHGKPIARSILELAGGGVQTIACEGILIFIVLLPFFAYIEISRAIGSEELHSLLFRIRTRAGTIQPRVQHQESQKRPA